MRVDVTLKGGLAEALPGGRGSVEMPDGSNVGSVLSALGIAFGQCVFVVNGAAVAAGALLREGDRVQVFPAAAGG
jgi:sulfur carrier protein ThiS